MPDQSIRGFLASLQQHDEIVRFTREVDPDENLSALSWQTYARLGKACLFENLKGYPGWRVVSQIVADRRKWAIALGVSEDEVVATLGERMAAPQEPILVDAKDAPVKEVIKLGDDVDLASLPAMWTSEADPGRYIASGMCIIKDPETGIRNMSVHRAQVVAADRTGYLICPRQALKIYQMYGALDRPMEAAMVIGGHPAMVFSAGYVAPYGQDELSVAGGLLGEPIRMVKCETIDMEVPADAEIVLEGELRPGEMTDEGPFGEVTGGYAQEGSTPLFRIKAITYRKDPIFYAMQCGLPPSDTHSIVCTTIEMRLWEHLKSVAGGLDLLDVRCIGTVSPMMVVLKLKPRFAGQARAALLAALSSPYLHPKIAVAVDEDIDISDLGQVYWAMANRVRDTGDLQKVNRARVFALDNASPVEEGMSAMYRVGSKVMIDATKDFSLPRVQRRHRHELGHTPRADVVAALGVNIDDPISGLAGRLAATGLCAEAAGGESATAVKAADLPLGASDGPWTGAILVVGQGDGAAPLIGIVDVRRDKRERLALGQLSWRLAEALRAAPTARRPAALLLGAPASCVLGAALDGWRGRGAWEMAAAIAGETLSFETIAGGITIPADTGLLIEGTLVESGRTEVIEWGFDVTAAASRERKDSSPSFETLRMDALAIEIAVAEHIRPIESGLDILDVRCFPETENRLVVVKLRPKVEGQSKTACMGALSSPEIGPRLVIAVDDDVDASDLRDVSWSFASRLHAEYDVAGIDGLPATQDGLAEIGAAFKWFVDAAKPPLTQTEKRAEFDRAIPKNLSRVVLDEFLPD